ncbi:MAG TPA: hypothetical protein VGM64_10660 [Lacunisphaera sp.]
MKLAKGEGKKPSPAKCTRLCEKCMQVAGKIEVGFDVLKNINISTHCSATGWDESRSLARVLQMEREMKTQPPRLKFAAVFSLLIGMLPYSGNQTNKGAGKAIGNANVF